MVLWRLLLPSSATIEAIALNLLFNYTGAWMAEEAESNLPGALLRASTGVEDQVPHRGYRSSVVVALYSHLKSSAGYRFFRVANMIKELQYFNGQVSAQAEYLLWPR